MGPSPSLDSDPFHGGTQRGLGPCTRHTWWGSSGRPAGGAPCGWGAPTPTSGQAGLCAGAAPAVGRAASMSCPGVVGPAKTLPPDASPEGDSLLLRGSRDHGRRLSLAVQTRGVREGKLATPNPTSGCSGEGSSLGRS